LGLCLLVGGVRHREQGFQVQGASAALAVLSALAVMTLVLPNHLVATPGPTVSRSQLVFVGVVSLVLYLVYVFVQTIRHRDYFLAETGEGEDVHAPPPPIRAVLASVGLLGAAAGAGEPVAEQPQPGARVRAGEHRADDPGDSGGVDRVREADRTGDIAQGHILLALTLLVGVITLGTGRTTVLQGAVHLVIFAAYLFLTVVP
jgi:Ca2+:H+ antiporter